jgi:hypothetical protein
MSKRRIEGQCAGCGCVSVAPLCPACTEEKAVYQQWRARRKGMPRAFVGYLELLDAWKARRNECKGLRKENEALKAEAKAARAELARSKGDIAASGVLLSCDTEQLAREVVELREKLRVTEERLECARMAALDAVRTSYRANMSMLERALAIPEDIVKPLRSLCHPDRWQGTPQEGIANRVMQWIN